MALARAARVIRLAGNPTDQQQETLTLISEIIDDSDQMVYDYTRTIASDWVEGITYGFDWAREASEKLAASRLCDEFNDINKKAEIYNKDGMDKLKILRQIGYGLKDGDNPAFYSSTSRHKAIALSASVGRYRSRNFFGGEVDY